MIPASWKLVFFISIYGITIMLPFILLPSLRLSSIKLLLLTIGLLAIVIILSSIIALLGNCSFSNTILMIGDDCHAFPLVKRRSLEAIFTLLITFIVSFLIAVIRDVVLWYSQKSKKAVKEIDEIMDSY